MEPGKYRDRPSDQTESSAGAGKTDSQVDIALIMGRTHLT